MSGRPWRSRRTTSQPSMSGIVIWTKPTDGRCCIAISRLALPLWAARAGGIASAQAVFLDLGVEPRARDPQQVGGPRYLCSERSVDARTQKRCELTKADVMLLR